MATFSGTDKAIGYLFDMVSNIADDYDSTATYSVNDYAVYDGVLYKCTSAITIAEDFTPSHWTAVLVMDEISAGGGGGGSSTLSGLTDVAISSPANGQSLVFDSSLNKWKNGAGSGGGSGSGVACYTLNDILDSYGQYYCAPTVTHLRQYRPDTPALIIVGNVGYLRLTWQVLSTHSSNQATIMLLKQEISDLLFSSTDLLSSTHYGSFLYANRFVKQNNDEWTLWTYSNTIAHRVWVENQNGKLRLREEGSTSNAGSIYELTAVFTLPVSASGIAHEYSTTEHIVGKWIDGRSVYETTINCGHNYTGPSSGTLGSFYSISYDIQSLGAEQVLSVEGFDESGMNLPFFNPLNTEYAVFLYANKNSINIRLGTGFVRTNDVYVTIRYIKPAT